MSKHRVHQLRQVHVLIELGDHGRVGRRQRGAFLLDQRDVVLRFDLRGREQRLDGLLNRGRDRHAALAQQHLVGLDVIGHEVDEHGRFFGILGVLGDRDELRRLEVVLRLRSALAARQSRQLELARVARGGPHGDQLVAPHVVHGRLGRHDRARLDAGGAVLGDVLLLRRRRASFLQAHDHLQVVDHLLVIRVRQRLAVGAERPLAVAEIQPLPQLDVRQGGSNAVDAKLRMQLVGGALEVRPGPLRIRERNACLFECFDVQHDRLRVVAQVHRVQLAVDAAAIDRGFRHAVELDGAGARLVVERHEQIVRRPLRDVGVVLLHQVRQVLAGGLRGHLGPVVLEAGELIADRDVGILLLEHLDDLDGAVVPILRAPPRESKLNGLRCGGRRGGWLGSRRSRRGRRRRARCAASRDHERHHAQPCQERCSSHRLLPLRKGR